MNELGRKVSVRWVPGWYYKAGGQGPAASARSPRGVCGPGLYTTTSRRPGIYVIVVSLILGMVEREMKVLVGGTAQRRCEATGGGNIEPQRKREPPAASASASASPTGGSATLKRKKPIPAPVPPPPQLPVPPPVPKKPASSASPAPPPRAAPGAPPGALPGGENFYESISEVKPGGGGGGSGGGGGGSGGGSGTTTIFTFNDGMEMYVTGL
ncbi:unnamed protein product [Boreogadus saida]